VEGADESSHIGESGIRSELLPPSLEGVRNPLVAGRYGVRSEANVVGDIVSREDHFL
jgi:hypothetical protein